MPSGMAQGLRKQTFTWLDDSVFVIYLLGTVAIGTIFVRGQRALSEYSP